MKRRTLRVEFVLQDAWVGAYWKTRCWWGGFSDAYFDLDSEMPVTEEQQAVQHRTFNLWVCLLPMLPIHLTSVYCPRPSECSSLSCWARDERRDQS